MVTALTGVLGLFKDFGLSAATVQRESITDAQVSSLFWINLAIGALLTIVVIVLAPAIAAFYDKPALRLVAVALAPAFVVNAAGIQHSALLQREMRFSTIAALEVTALVVSIAVAVTMGVMGFGYWALVGMTLAAPATYSLGVWLTTGWVPGLPGRRSDIRPMLGLGSIVTLNGIVIYIAYNLEKVLLGRFWGAEALGLYGRAYQLVSIPTENLNAAAGQIAFSALARVKHDPARLRRYFLAAYSLLVAVTFPLTGACALFATDLIAVILGPKWADAAVIFRILAPTIVVFAMINPLSWLLLSLGLVGRSLKIALVLCPLIIASYVIGLPYGPVGVALGYSTLMVLWAVPHLAWCVRNTVVSMRDIARVVLPPLVSTAIAAGVAGGLVVSAHDSLSPLGRLTIGVGLLTGIYLAILLFVLRQRTVYRDIFRHVVGAYRASPAN
jgi:PST family polysaccharide transporter